LIEKYVLPGHLPEKPVFTRDSSLMTIGSCFAEELKTYLLEQGLPSAWMCVLPQLNNTYALRQFFEWCVTGKQSSEAYWYDEAEGGGAEKWRPEWEQKAYREYSKDFGMGVHDRTGGSMGRHRNQDGVLAWHSQVALRSCQTSVPHEHRRRKRLQLE
jgi:hypothetical protein